MLPAVLTAVLFSISIVCASRSTRLLGSTNANFFRLMVALACLGAFAHLAGKGYAGPGFRWFLLSGALGIGAGDIATFQALGRVGPRLTILMVQCLSAPFGAIIEWVWLGTELTDRQMTGGSILLVGVTIALLPGIKIRQSRQEVLLGTFFGWLGAFCQATGAVVTRKANQVNESNYFQLDHTTAAYQRMIGGLIVILLFFLAMRLVKKAQSAGPIPEGQVIAPFSFVRRLKGAAPWVFANAMAGLTFGVICFQWALRNAPAAVVLCILAMTPVIVMPIAYLFDDDRPCRLAILGGIIAVVGVIVLQTR